VTAPRLALAVSAAGHLDRQAARLRPKDRTSGVIALRIDAPCGRLETTWQIAGAAEACGY
jgi:hypothetical protein